MTANCVDLIRSAVNGKMSDDELISLYERVKKMRETISRRKDRVSDLNAEIKRQIRTRGEEKIAELEKQMEASATDFVRLNQLTEEKEEQERLLEEKMERYVYLCDLADRIAEQS